MLVNGYGLWQVLNEKTVILKKKKYKNNTIYCVILLVHYAIFI